MALGHFMMAFEPLFYPALATIALGNGLFLPSLPSQINDLYRADDPRRGRAYNVYYVGINIGGFLAPLGLRHAGRVVRLALRDSAPPASACSLGLCIYLIGGTLPAAGAAATRGDAPAATARRCAPMTADASGAAARRRHRASWFSAAPTSRSATRCRCGPTSAWIAHGGGFVIPMTWFQALNPLLVISMTPLLSRIGRGGAAAAREPAPATQDGDRRVHRRAGVLLLRLVACVRAATRTGSGSRCSSLLFTIGELYILPTGLGLFARLAPAGLRRPRSPPGSWRRSAATCWPAPWAPCGATWRTRRSSS